jgi:hypothetical protein
MKSHSSYASILPAAPGPEGVPLTGSVQLQSDGISFDLAMGPNRQVATLSFQQVGSLSEDRGLVSACSDLLLARIEIENTIIRTLPTRQSIRNWRDRLPFVMIATPWKGCPIQECSLLAVTYPGVTYTGFDFGSAVSDMQAWLDAKLYSPILFDGPNTVAAGSSAIVRVTAPPNMTAYLDCDAGNLSYWRVKGEKNVKVSAVDLLPGDSIKIKAGYRNWPGESDFLIQVTE